MIENIEQQLARDEGRETKPYRDQNGWWTIGIGHNLQVKTFSEVPEQFQQGIRDGEIDELFSADLDHVCKLLAVYVPWWDALDGPDGPRSNVLVNMGFNLGVQGLAAFHTFLGYMHRQQWQQAVNALKTTKVYGQLPHRYGRLADQIISGQWV